MKGAAIKKKRKRNFFLVRGLILTHLLFYNLQIAFDARICCTRQEPVSHGLKDCKIKFIVLKINLKSFHQFHICSVLPPKQEIEKKKKRRKIFHTMQDIIRRSQIVLHASHLPLFITPSVRCFGLIMLRSRRSNNTDKTSTIRLDRLHWVAKGGISQPTVPEEETRQ